MALNVVVGLMAGSLLAPAVAFPAGPDPAGAIPDSALMDSLRVAVARARVFRAIGGFGRREIRHPLLDSTGVRSADWASAAGRRPAFVTTASAPRPRVTPPIPWSEISTLETARPRKLQGAVAGAIVGIALGAGLASASLDRGYADEGDSYRAIGIFGGTLVTSTILGTIIGSMTGSRTIYRAKARENI